MKVTTKPTPSINTTPIEDNGISVVLGQTNVVNTTFGIPGPEGPSGVSTITGANDVIATNLTDGSLLIYDEMLEKWVTGTQLNKQSVDCGEF